MDAGAARRLRAGADGVDVAPEPGPRQEERLGDHDDDELNLLDLRNSLGSEMWRDVGIRRERAGLESAERQVDFWTSYVAAREFADPSGWELQNMLLVSRLMIAGALTRQRHPPDVRGVPIVQVHPGGNTLEMSIISRNQADAWRGNPVAFTRKWAQPA